MMGLASSPQHTTHNEPFFYTKRAIDASRVISFHHHRHTDTILGLVCGFMGFLSSFYIFEKPLEKAKFLQNSESMHPFIQKHKRLVLGSCKGMTGLIVGGIWAIIGVPLAHTLSSSYFTTKLATYGLLKDVFEK